VLRVTDSNGTVTELAHAQIFGDSTKGVVPFLDGAIQFDIPLSKVSNISVRDQNHKLEMTVTLRSGEKRTGWIMPASFVGQTALGQAQIGMYNVREVENVTRR
jgi:hydrogenase/urease accessory protein HupE